MTAFMGFTGDLPRKALEALGHALGAGPPVEMLIIGGAAGQLNGFLPKYLATQDVDAVFIKPPSIVDELLEAANRVATSEKIPAGWLNHDDVGLFAHTVPEGWETRCANIGVFGRLHVFAIGRKDFIAMKFFAHRQVDIEHLVSIHPDQLELEFTRKHLERLRSQLPEETSKIAMALYLLTHWTDHE